MVDLTREQIERLAVWSPSQQHRDLAAMTLSALTRAESAEAERDRLAAEVGRLRETVGEIANAIDDAVNADGIRDGLARKIAADLRILAGVTP